MAKLFGSLGDDSLSGHSGPDLLHGGPAPDPTFDTGDDTLAGGAGRDTLLGYGGDDSLDGQDGDDRLEGGDGDDWLHGYEGLDTVLGGGGDDTLFSGSDDFTPNNADTLDGGDGDDVVWIAWNEAQPGEVLTGGAGFDILQLGRGTVSVTAAVSGFEKLEIGAYASISAAQLLGIAAITPFETGQWGNWTKTPSYTLNATTAGLYDFSAVTICGMALFQASVGADTVLGSVARDLIRGGFGDDRLSGRRGADSLDGGEGRDELAGGAGDDRLSGGEGDDRLRGNTGADTLFGGTGADVFQFHRPDRGLDTIQDFLTGADRIRIDPQGFGIVPGAELAFRGFTDADDLASTDPTFVYDAATGTLAFDLGGGTADDAIVFVILAGAPALAAADLLIIR